MLVQPLAPSNAMLFADTNNILAIVSDFSIRADGTMAEGVAWAKPSRFENTDPGPEQSAQGTGIGEAGAIVDYQRPALES